MSLLRDYVASLTQPTLTFPAADAREERFDEVVDADGSVRSAWKAMASVAVDLTSSELDRIDGEIAGLLADDGVTYGNPESGAEPWQLDPVPLVMDAATWAPLEVGLAQRAELLSAILADVYGEQRLLSEGILPSAVVFGHGGFLRAVTHFEGPDPHTLLLSGTDVGRDSAGEWHVISDRVQAPSGLGYAMANRRVISRVLPELFEEAGLHRMEPYFSAVRSALLHAAPDVADPRIVVLSPGTHSETAYDQAFLANILGFPLVQGSDLVVRDGWLWLKPAGFPRNAPHERVDVIVRRVDAEWCDPLELRSGSQLGVAGLTEVVRRGRVRLVNGLGSGVLENPGLMPFLPAICERVLGEQLRLPSVPTWWCGDPDARAHVLAALDAGDPAMIVRTIDGRLADVEGMTPPQLAARVREAPHRYVGQQRLVLSQAPAWDRTGHRSGQVAAQPLVLRTFTVRDGATFRPLAGGLATLSHTRGTGAPTTKDVWVLKASPSDPDQGLTAPEAFAVPRVAPALGPRVLEDMFWSGRYTERAEDTLRLIITAQAYAEQLGYSSLLQGDAVLTALVGALRRICGTRWQDADEELRSLVLDGNRPGSAAHSLDRLRDALEGVRDQLSTDTWRTFGITDRAMKVLRGSHRTGQIAESAGRMLTGILSLQGVTANMVRDDGWHALEAGRHLERALQVCSLVGATTITAAAPGVERAVMGGVLMAAESAVTHRRRYRGDVRIVGLLELLLSEPTNPRSLAFALDRVREHLSALEGSTGSTRPERLLESVEDSLELADMAALSVVEDGRRERLDDFLTSTRAQLHTLGEAIAHLHFESGPLPQPLLLPEMLAVSS